MTTKTKIKRHHHHLLAEGDDNLLQFRTKQIAVMKGHNFIKSNPLFLSVVFSVCTASLKSLQGSVNNEWHPAASTAFNCWDKATHAAAT